MMRTADVAAETPAAEKRCPPDRAQCSHTARATHTTGPLCRQGSRATPSRDSCLVECAAGGVDDVSPRHHTGQSVSQQEQRVNSIHGSSVLNRVSR